jgi:hypothetical protein
MKKFIHCFSIGFSVESDNKGEDVTPDELMEALAKRVRNIKDDGNEILEACGLPDDTELNEEEA